MKIKFLVSFIILVVFKTSLLNAQCFELIKNKGFQVLDTNKYIPEGRFDAMTLSEGDYLNVYKSFFRGKAYRLAVVGAENMPRVKFQIKTMQGQIIYDNSADGNSNSWNYVSDRNQNLAVYVEIPSSAGTSINSGCIAVILGYKMN